MGAVIRADLAATMGRTGPDRLVRGLGRLAGGLGLAYLAVLVAAAALPALSSHTRGPVAFLAIFAPFFYLLTPALVVPAVRRRAWGARLALAGVALLFLLQFHGALLPPAPVAAAPGAPQLRVATWNLYGFNSQLGAIRRGIADADADVVGLIELNPTQSAAIEADAALTRRYPARLLRPHATVLGIGLLSADPVLERTDLDDPPALVARLGRPDGRPLTVVVAHPLPAPFQVVRAGGLALPVGIDPAERDAEIRRVRALAAPALARGEPVLLIGDFNVTEREAGYRALSAGPVDAQLAAGAGFGPTWKSPFLLRTDFAALRIDYLFSGPGLLPLEATTDCRAAGSDHCLLSARYALPAP
jgi:endonuclease/exonuclease/phosphatase (EEP) superfamily protein YafD